jgi:hypothetical protein
MEPHRLPYSDSACDQGLSFGGFDLAHSFYTDVAQIRVGRIVPLALATDGTALDREIVCRTIIEALRKAAANLYQIPERELGVTYRPLSSGLEIVLFDSVSGGAGYSERVVGGDFEKLFREAIHVLTCSKGCSASCSGCLRSFTNQRYWDDFRRIEALDWFEGVLRLKRKTVQEMGGTEISREVLDVLLKNSTEIVVFSRSLGDFGGDIPMQEEGTVELPVLETFKGWKQIKRWIADGKKVTLRASNIPSFQDPAQPKARRLAESLLPEVSSGSLVIERAFIANPPDFLLLEPGGKRTGVHIIEQSLQPLSSVEINSGSVLIVKTPNAEDLVKYDSIQGKISEYELRPPAGAERFNFGCGQVRDFRKLFGFLAAKKIARLRISDRYCLAEDWAEDYLFEFMREIGEIAASPIAELKLEYGPAANLRDQLPMQRRFENLKKRLEKLGNFSNTRIDGQLRLDKRTRNYHDRRIHCETEMTNSSAASGRSNRRPAATNPKYLLELTGGVSNLIDQGHETTVYLMRI